ncbi:TraB/GumN family protein [Alteromonas antoniana]|uniref:TraB/GumN family protein n=1 Tax=Alteromonas antoniana TaxID=2803813 RepID=UPI001C474B9A|nr:TraB/GumN family protein [Alteromonas antoniana]
MRRIASLALASLLALPAYSASVWKVSDGENTMYLGGTLHILSPQDYPLPEEYKTAYSQSDALVFETDIAALSTPEFAQKSLQMLTYGEGGSLKDDVSDDTLKQLETHLAARGVPVDRFMNLRPALVGISLSMIEFQRLGLTSQGVDKYYYTLGMGDGKAMHYLESPEQQLTFISKMGEGNEDAYVSYAIEDVKRMPEMLGDLKDDWREGDMASFYALSMEEFADEYPDIYDLLLTSRNNNWMPVLTDLMTTPETEFVLVGAMHIPGDTGLITQLKAKGYSVEQMK